MALKTEKRDLMGAGVGVSGGIVGLPMGRLTDVARQLEIEASDMPITLN